MSWHYKFNLYGGSSNLVSFIPARASVSSSSSTSTSKPSTAITPTNTDCKLIKERQRPFWLQLIVIFFSKRMLYAAAQYGISFGVMLHYHTRLGFHLFLLAACIQHYGNN